MPKHSGGQQNTIRIITSFRKYFVQMGSPFLEVAPGTTFADTGIMQGFRPNGIAFLSLDAHFSVEVIYFGRFKDLYFVYNGRTKESEAINLRGSYAKQMASKRRVVCPICVTKLC
jgi:hypothetical protein